jgi:Fic family protein
MQYELPEIILNGDLQESLKNIEKVIDDLNRRRDSGLDKDLEEKLKRHLLISQVYNSNAIEGNKLTLRETELILEGMVINDRPLKDEIEAKSLANATEYLYRLIDGSEPLTKRTILELHGLIMADIPYFEGGRFRSNEVIIKNSSHKPPSFLFVEEHIDEMFKWMNRNAHKHSPLVMAAILHHWLTWIHPFSDGNGRTARLFLDFFLLQKGYPEIIVKIADRDRYYDALIEADKGNIESLVELFTEKIRQTVNIYEEFINENERQKFWKEKYKEISEENYQKAKETYSFEYEVWKNQVAVFKILLKECIREIEIYLGQLKFYIKEYDPLSFSQYLDILEDRKVTNTWYVTLNIFEPNKDNAISFIFYFERFKFSKPTSIFGQKDIKNKYRKRFTNDSKPQIKLYVSARQNQTSQNLKEGIDLVNIGTWGDQLSFGLNNRERRYGQGYNKQAKIITVRENPGKVIRNFIDQILFYYFSIGKKNV